MTTAEYPYKSGDVTVIGPECFIDAQRRVISYCGENYYVARPVEGIEQEFTHSRWRRFANRIVQVERAIATPLLVVCITICVIVVAIR